MAPAWRHSLLEVPAPQPSGSGPEKDLVPAAPKHPPLPKSKLCLAAWGHGPTVPLPRSALVGLASMMCISEPQTVNPPGTATAAPASPSRYEGHQRPWGAPRAFLLELPSPDSPNDQEVTEQYSCCHHGEGVQGWCSEQPVPQLPASPSLRLELLRAVARVPWWFGVCATPSASPHPPRGSWG